MIVSIDSELRRRTTETYVAGSAQKSNQRTLDHVFVNTDTPDLLVAAGCRAFYVRSSLDITTTSNGVLLVVLDVEADAHTLQGISQRRNGTSSASAQLKLLAVYRDDTLKHTLEIFGILRLARGWGRRRLRAVGRNAVVDNSEARIRLEEVCLLEQVGNFVGQQLATQLVGFFLYNVGKDHLQATGQVEVEMAQNDPSGTTLAGLGVDADNSLVCAADIFGVEGQVGQLPLVLVGFAFFFALLEALLDGVLVGAGKGTDDQGATVRSTLVDGDLVAHFYGINDALEIGKVNIGVDTLSIQVQTESHQVNVASSLAVTK